MISSTLIGFVQQHARLRPGHTALVFLPDGEAEDARLSYAELDRRASAFAARLQAGKLTQQCILLMLPSGVDYVVAFLGCLYANATPVPAYPATNSIHAERLAQIVRDCGAKAAVVASKAQGDETEAKLAKLFTKELNFSYLSVGEHSLPDEHAWINPSLCGDGLAFLQYTSGSTSRPRGVMVTHDNLVRYCQSWQAATGQDHTDVYVTWLPLFHDMGLIGCVVQALFMGATIVMMPPMAFLQSPTRWLAAISRYQGTIGFAPNFAYDLCADAADDVAIAALDLSSWALAVMGAEPVRAETVSRFMQRFSPTGLRSAALNPGYGLAEGTLSVVQHARLQMSHVVEVDAQALQHNRFSVVRCSQAPAPSPTGSSTRSFVSCGRTWLDVKLVIANPDTLHACGDSEVGEIWVSGPTVAAGYWQRPQETAATFGAYLDNGEGPFLRTGDLGALYQGELYITGRIKDVIIIRGQNHYPQDIEWSVAHAHPALRAGRGAAFSIEVDQVEKLVIVQEVERSQRKHVVGKQVVQAIRAAVAEQHGLAVHAIVLLKPAAVHITSSGKIQRSACKQDFLDRRCDALYEWLDDEDDGARPATTAQASNQHEKTRNTGALAETVSAWLTVAISQKMHLTHAQVDVRTPFSGFGMDSMALVALSGALSSWLGRPVDPVALFNYPTIERLAQHIAGAPAHAASQTTAAQSPGTAGAVAIVGMACRFPGAASVDAYWQLLATSSNAVTQVPASRWRTDDFYTSGEPRDGRMNTRWGGFLDDVDTFDAQFFGISAREAKSMDPQQRLLLQTTWHALEDAGIAPDSLAASKTGVFVGISTDDYRALQHAQQAGLDAYAGTGNAASIAANRISYFFDLRGPSMAIDTACSSSLVALHQARTSLCAGECDLAIVAGVNLILAPGNTIIFSQARMMAADGQCKAFDAHADGYVRGEGCGVVILKRHTKASAEAAGQHRIHALVLGSAVNQDGRSNGLTAPNGLAQESVIRQALEAARVLPSQVGYVEAHGTGTPLGDPIEMAAINAVYGAASTVCPALWIGSVKTNIGHLEAAAGIAGLLKLVLAMQHRSIPAHLHLQQLNPGISFAGTRCGIPQVAQAWADGALPRIAGISSFGFGGTNAHVIVQQAPAAKDADGPGAQDAPEHWHLLPLSARSDGALKRLAQAYASHLAQPAGNTLPLAAFCCSAALHRAHHGERVSVLARTSEEARGLLGQFVDGAAHDGLVHSGQRQTRTPGGKLAMLFTGQGSQYSRMGLSLLQTYAGFKHTLEQCDAIVQRCEGWSLCALLEELDGADAKLAQTQYAQPTLFALEYALAQLWQAHGVQPDYLMGHSLGEYVAACVAGIFSLEDGLQLVTHRGRLMQHHTEAGAMLAVRGSPDLIASILAQSQGGQYHHLAIAAHNSAEEVVLSGTPEHVQVAALQLTQTGAHVTRLQTGHAFHSPLMRSMVVAFAHHARQVRYHPPRIALVSNLSGKLAGAEMACAEYWVQHVLAPVQFAQGLQTLDQCGCSVFVEAGPQPVLSVFGRQTMPGARWLASLRRGVEDDLQFQRSLAEFHVAGGTVNWQSAMASRDDSSTTHTPIDLPLYPFEAERHWFDTQPGTLPIGVDQRPLLHPLLGRKVSVAGVATQYFENVLAAQQPWFVEHHRMLREPVLPASAIIEWALSALSHANGTPPTQWALHGIAFTRMLVVTQGQTVPVQLTVQPQGDGGYRITCYSHNAADQDTSWQEHASLMASPIAGKPRTASAPVSIASITAGLAPQDGNACYTRFQQMGMEYAAAFQGLRSLWRHGNRALACIEVPQATRDGNDYYLHPVVLDACLHPLSLFVDVVDAAMLPCRISQVCIYGPLPASVWSLVEWHGEQPGGACSADVTLYADDGACIAMLECVELMPVTRPGTTSANQSADDGNGKKEDSSAPGVQETPEDTMASITSTVATLGAPQAKQIILDYLLERTALALDLDTEHRASLRTSFEHVRLNTLGLDSLMAVELRNQLLQELKVDIQIRHFISGSTGADVVDLIYERLMFKGITANSTDAVAESLEKEVWTL